MLNEKDDENEHIEEVAIESHKRTVWIISSAKYYQRDKLNHWTKYVQVYPFQAQEENFIHTHTHTWDVTENIYLMFLD